MLPLATVSSKTLMLGFVGSGIIFVVLLWDDDREIMCVATVSSKTLMLGFVDSGIIVLFFCGMMTGK